MASDGSGEKNVSVSVPIGLIVGGALLGLAMAAFLLVSKSDEVGSDATTAVTRSGKGAVRKVGLMTLVTLIENDITRRVVVAVLKSMARRA
jgi:hypothetical protein